MARLTEHLPRGTEKPAGGPVIGQSALFGVDLAATITTNDDWYTPPWIFDAAGELFDMDVCAPPPDYPRTCPARRYLTIADDGLSTPWQGLIWCNPPYSRVAPWADRWAAHDSGLLLVPASAGTAWRGRVCRAAAALALIDCRFGRPDGSRASIPYALLLAARGPVAVRALGRIAAADQVAAGAYHATVGE